MKRMIPVLLVAACGPKVPGTEPFRPEPAPPDAAETTAAPDEGLDDTAQTILDAHNQYRAQHCAPDLAWSDELADAAQGWADKLRKNGCAFEHSDLPYGENLAAGSTGYLPPEAAVQMWYDESKSYDYKHGGFSMDTGHFTQLVWHDTARVGCGMAQCNGLDIWVCEYDPPGNVDGEYQQQVKKPC